ncbi:hypothetical protein VUR80DRAFT_930 [Thermomyces stellatus]
MVASVEPKAVLSPTVVSVSGYRSGISDLLLRILLGILNLAMVAGEATPVEGESCNLLAFSCPIWLLYDWPNFCHSPWVFVAARSCCLEVDRISLRRRAGEMWCAGVARAREYVPLWGYRVGDGRKASWLMRWVGPCGVRRRSGYLHAKVACVVRWNEAGLGEIRRACFSGKGLQGRPCKSTYHVLR